MKVSLNVWRQPDQHDHGRFVRYEIADISADMSFLEVLDVLNERLILTGEQPLAFVTTAAKGSAARAA